MWNIIKSINFQCKRDRGLKLLYLFMFGMILLTTFMNLSGSVESVTGSEMLVSNSSGVLVITGFICSFFLCRTIGGDYTDKTINYEVLTGKSRNNIFFARMIYGFSLCVLAWSVLVLLPYIVATAINGWGISVEFKVFVTRTLLLYLPLLRYMCEIMLITVLVRNQYLGMIISYLIFEISAVVLVIIKEILDIEKAVFMWTSSSNMINVFNFRDYVVRYINGEDVAVYGEPIPKDDLMWTVIVSLVVSLICIAVSYRCFKKRDM